MLKWFAFVVIPVAAALFILPLLCVGSDMYLWTDENGRMVISSEKPPEHIEEFKTLGVIETALESEQPSAVKAEYRDTGSQYDNFPPYILEKIKRTARCKWPRNKQMQEIMIDRQVRACRYVMNAGNLEIPTDIVDRIVEDIQHRWPDDYERQASDIEKQLQSYMAIAYYGNLNLSDDEIDLIKERAKALWPFDYINQEKFLRKQVEYQTKKAEQLENAEFEEEQDGLQTYTIRSLK